MGEPAETAPAWEFAADVQVGFVGADGARRLGPLARYWGEPFELGSPARKFAAFKGQKNFTGDYWAVTSRSLVGYESWVERDAAMALDFDPAVVALASQPFRLVWPDDERDREHTPDYFARLADGTGVVVDVRPQSLVDEEAAEVFAFTARICDVPSPSIWSASQVVWSDSPLVSGDLVRRAGSGHAHNVDQHARERAMRNPTSSPWAEPAQGHPWAGGRPLLAPEGTSLRRREPPCAGGNSLVSEAVSLCIALYRAFDTRSRPGHLVPTA
ncbi:TnsA-like heteromeric transposase endonuclease subunit [Streptomyces sp. NPDC002730]|uniref:TnsA-like heteromeric transposase endonuclease subunit n=1 Tax=Streptomyces sp. NPDC002730 TaxID=3364662 RepID=UPI00367781ED